MSGKARTINLPHISVGGTDHGELKDLAVSSHDLVADIMPAAHVGYNHKWHEQVDVDWDAISTVDELVAVLKSLDLPARLEQVPEDMKHLFFRRIEGKDPVEITRIRNEGWKFKDPEG